MERLNQMAANPIDTAKKNKFRFDRNAITPGTPFMEKLNNTLRANIQRQKATDPLWESIPLIIFSGADEPGEGEHKMIDYIRKAKLALSKNFNPHTRHCFYGLDADLIMLSLVSHEPHFSLLREEVNFSRTETKPHLKRSMLAEPTFQLLHLQLLREYLELEFKLDDCKKYFDLNRVIDDLILIWALLGNDFLP
ncbi:unnamed protein product, partial [Amoebophrya sp. A120]|eukprot:GSA120T00004099001.1